jgi:hypothetical protein
MGLLQIATAPMNCLWHELRCAHELGKPMNCPAGHKGHKAIHVIF